MSLLENYVQDLSNALNSPNLLVPPGTYQAVLISAEENEERGTMVLNFQLQGNPGLTMMDGSPVDGCFIAHTLWFPKPEDKLVPATGGRGTKWDTKLGMVSRALKALGWSPERGNISSCYGTTVLLDVQHETYQGEMRERVQRIKPLL